MVFQLEHYVNLHNQTLVKNVGTFTLSLGYRNENSFNTGDLQHEKFIIVNVMRGKVCFRLAIHYKYHIVTFLKHNTMKAISISDVPYIISQEAHVILCFHQLIKY